MNVSWTIKKTEHWRMDAFELWCWRRLLRVAWTARRSNQSILKKINPEYSLKGLVLKLQYFGHLMQKAHSLEKTLVQVKTEGKRKEGNRGWDGWMAPSTQWTRVWANSGREWRTRNPGMLQSLRLQSTGRSWVTEQQILPNTPLPPRLPHHIKIPSSSRTIYWNASPLSIELSWCLCEKSVDSKCLDISLNSLVSLFFGPYHNTTLAWLS